MHVELKRTALTLALAALAPSAAHAVTASSTFQVSATVIPVCTISSGGNLDFGNYDPNVATATPGATSLQLTCTKSTGYSVALASANAFAMKNGTESLTYALYSDSGRSTAWSSTSAVTGTAATKSPFTLNVYGSIPAGQDVSTGTPSGGVSSGKVYTDTITATVTF